MKRHILLSVIIALYSLTINSQTGFQKIFGSTGNDAGYSVLQTADSGYVFSGCWNCYSSAGLNGVFVIKADKNGNGLWTKLYKADPSQYYTGAYSIIKTNDNNFAIAGYTRRPGNFFINFYLLKADQNGDTLWTKVHGNNALNLYAYSANQTQDNGYIMSGYSSPAWYPNIYILKTDASGNYVWSKDYFPDRYGVAHSAIETSNGYMIFGHVAEINNSAASDIYLINTNSSGDTLWQKTLPGNNDDQGFCIQKTPDNGFIISGATMSYGSGGYDAYLVKVNSNGIIQWSKTFGGLDDEYANHVSLTSDGGYIIAGSTNSVGSGGFDAHIIKTDSLGNQQWSSTYGVSTDDYAYSIQQTYDGGYIFTGIRNNNIYLVKIDQNGIVTNSNEIDPEAQLNNIHVYPNPFSSETTINTAKQLTDASLVITNTLGQNVKIIQNIKGNSITLTRENLPAGIYHVSITENNTVVAKEKLVIAD